MKLSTIFSDGMVLQRGMPIPIWGRANAGEQINIRFGDQTLGARADAQGKWIVRFPASKAGGPLEMTIAGADRNVITIRDIHIGEVWFASGQSNMHWTFAPTHGVVNNAAELAAANDPLNRQFTVGKIATEHPAENVTGQWLSATPENFLIGDVNGASAVGYFFARELRQKLNVPVGIINASLGGTNIERWFPGGDLYNGMMDAIIPYAIRGAIWYQGESNVLSKASTQYFQKQKDLITGWRQRWGQGDFSFYFVQLAPWLYGNGSDLTTEDLPIFWEAQTATLSVPNTGMVVSTDIGGDITNIHPPNKQDIGKRLALWALAKNYDRSDLIHSGPLYKSHVVENGKIRLMFDHADGLTGRDGSPLVGFTIAGVDGKFETGTAIVDGQTVIVQSDKITNPKAVRYGWTEAPTINLINKAGLPASPFRTDKAEGLPR